jgi:O-antigen ligase
VATLSCGEIATSALIDLTGSTHPIGKALAVVLGLFLLSVVYRGGNVDALVVACAYVAISVVSLTIASAWKQQAFATTLPWWALVAALGIIIIMGTVALLPVSSDTFLALPGRAYYEAVLSFRYDQSHSTSLPIGIDMKRAQVSLLVALGALAIVLGVSQLTRTQLMGLLGVFAILAIFQAILGFIQLGLGSPSFLAFGSAVGGRRAAGTFVNKNHFATFLAMALPLLLMRSVGCFSFFTDRQRDTKLRRAWWGFATAITAAALVSSVSRAGTTAGFAVAVLTVLICAWTARERSQRIAFLLIGALALLVASFAGLQLMMASLAGSAFEQGIESRQLLNKTTWAGAMAFFPLGAGLGSYALAFPRFQSETFVGFVEHAHNDYLQLLFELGFAGVLVLICFGLAWLLQVARLYSLRAHTPLANPATACALGALAFAIHAWFDFPAHIPAVAWTACLLMAAACHPALTSSRMTTRISGR